RRERGDDSTHLLAWTSEGTTVALRLRIQSATAIDANGQGKRGLRGVQLPAAIAGASAVTAAP
ncbi:hypothetical protein, partial [Luteibacter sp.]|uniref:hypothetical protein n=1 Tax=Luteibacter sp. TaxID=1886636 RepID=UPI002F3E5FA3